jgi:hypothetical protein
MRSNVNNYVSFTKNQPVRPIPRLFGATFVHGLELGLEFFKCAGEIRNTQTPE